MVALLPLDNHLASLRCTTKGGFINNYFQDRILTVKIMVALAAIVGVIGCGKEIQSAPVQQAAVAAPLTPEQEFTATLKKAEAGDAKAQYETGTRYARAEGVEKDEKKALEWLLKSVSQKHPRALSMLSSAYAIGYLVPKDMVKSLALNERAAALGDATGQLNLGLLYERGEGVLEDKGKAFELFLKSAKLGNIDAQIKLAVSYQKGDLVLKDLAKSLDWRIKAAENGNTASMYMLGVKYEFGVDIPKDSVKALDWYLKGAAQGNSLAQMALGWSYATGEIVTPDAVLAYAWSNLAASKLNTRPAGEVGSPAETRDRVGAGLSPSELAEAQRLSSNWKKGQIFVREGASANAALTVGTISKQRNGTIFVVSKTGHAITNQHITTGCAELRIQGREGVAKLITEDAVNDLALIQIPMPVRDAAAIASEPGKLRQGDDVVVFGFPLNSLLSSGGNLTPGVVSALTGLGNNTNQIQITAPIQPGSSGSAVLNKTGEVIGVVSMKLSDSKMVTATGSVGQNVNFAVSGQTVKAFLDMNKVTYRSGGFFSRDKTTADLADEARKWTMLVECWR